MELDLLRDLLRIMEENELSELEVEQEGTRVRLKKAGAETNREVVTQASPAVAETQTLAEEKTVLGKTRSF